MKIGILTQYYPPEFGAPQARLSQLASSLVCRGHEVFVLTAMPNYPTGRIFSGYGGWSRREQLEGATVWRSYVFATRKFAGVARIANYLSFAISSFVVGCLVLPKLDFLITESPPLSLGATGFLLSRLKRAKWIFNVSDLWPESAARLGALKPGRLLWLAQQLEAFSYRKAWLVSGQTYEILGNIKARYPFVQTYHLSNGVDTSVFGPSHRSSTVRTFLLSGCVATCVALYAGVQGAAQGLQDVLAAAALLKQNDQVTFVLIGDGPERESLVNYARDHDLTNVRFLEPQGTSNMPGLVASADIALVPLKTWLPGAVPSKLYEAMGSGVAVVLVAKGEPAEILAKADAGIQVLPGDVRGLAKAIITLCSDEALRARFGANGRRAAVELYDRRTILSRFVEYLEGNVSC